MKRALGILAVVACGGCAAKGPIGPRCVVDAIVVTEFDGSKAFVEEQKYNHLPAAVAPQITQALRAQLEQAALFKSVTIADSCPKGMTALRISGEIASFLHFSRSFHLGVRGQIHNCQSGNAVPYDLPKLNPPREGRFDSGSGSLQTLPGFVASHIREIVRYRAACR